MKRATVAFTLSVDTEEDNWLPARDGVTVRNILELSDLSSRFERLGIRATYFVTYRVAVDADASAVLRDIGTRGVAEIGAHLHPWNTPPDCGLEAAASMLKDYPQEVQRQKIVQLVAAIESGTGSSPTAFRAGRFGVGASTISALLSSGIFIDSSVTPLLSWEAYDNGPSFVSAPLRIYRLDGTGDVCRPVEGGPLVEVPISVGFTRRPPARWQALTRLLHARPARWLRIAGLAARTSLVRRVILSPETNSVEDMFRMTRRLVDAGVDHLHMFFHSNSLLPGLSPFTRSHADVERLLDRVERYVERLSAIGRVEFRTVSEAASAAGCLAGSPAFARGSDRAAASGEVDG